MYTRMSFANVKTHTHTLIVLSLTHKHTVRVPSPYMIQKKTTTSTQSTTELSTPGGRRDIDCGGAPRAGSCRCGISVLAPSAETWTGNMRIGSSWAKRPPPPRGFPRRTWYTYLMYLVCVRARARACIYIFIYI
jgi:hypothetical protein